MILLLAIGLLVLFLSTMVVFVNIDNSNQVLKKKVEFIEFKQGILEERIHNINGASIKKNDVISKLLASMAYELNLHTEIDNDGDRIFVKNKKEGK